MALLNPRPRAVNPIGREPITPAEIEERKLASVRVGRTYAKDTRATARSSTVVPVAGAKVSGGGRIRGGTGFKPDSLAVKVKP